MLLYLNSDTVPIAPPQAFMTPLVRQIRGENLNDIDEQFNIEAYSNVSSILRRVSKLKKYDRKIQKRIGEIQDSIGKGQK